MRIAIDARALSWTGIGRYTRNLVRELLSAQSPHEFVLLVGEKHEEQVRKEFPGTEIVPVESSYYSWREQTKLAWQLNRVRADIFHFTHFNVPLLFRRPYVVTIHDVTRFFFPGQKRQYLRQQLAYEYLLAATVRRAREVICVSQATYEDLLGLPLGIGRQELARKSHIIPEGVEAHFWQPVTREARLKVRMQLGIPNPYLLFVGVWMSHKNLQRILEAFRQLRASNPDLFLVLTGRPRPGYVDVLGMARRLGVAEAIVFAGYVPDHLLPALYAEARCLTFPSLYEGFGLPALEAAAVGTSVVAANVSALPEVLGPDAAAYCNPEYVPGITAAIAQVLAGGESLDAIRAAGRKRAASFAWKACAQKTLEVYHSLEVH